MKKYTDNGGNELIADELLPCPFCGGMPELMFIGNDYTKSRKVIIKCRKCRVQRTDAGLAQTHKQIAIGSIECWNRRAETE